MWKSKDFVTASDILRFLVIVAISILGVLFIHDAMLVSLVMMGLHPMVALGIMISTHVVALSYIARRIYARVVKTLELD